MNRTLTKIVVSLPIIFGFIYGIYLILVNQNFNPMIGLLLGFLCGITLPMLISVISSIKARSISESLESIMANIFQIGLILTILLTILLSVEWIPNYFNSLYILFGSIMVAAIGFYLNSRIEKEKEYRKIKRFKYVVNDSIKTNKEIAGKLYNTLNSFGGRKLDLNLNMGFFDILTSEIISMDLNPDLVRDLITIKELTFNVNDLILKRNDILNLLNEGIPIEAELFEAYDDSELAELSQTTRTLKRDLKMIIEESLQFLENHKILDE